MSTKNTKEKLPEQTNTSEDKKPNGAPKRQKIVKACKDCRRRKVKCDGGMPCGTCRRSMTNCIFEPSSPKRGATKHYIESLENRINVIERALNTLDDPTMKLVKEAMLRQQLIEEGALNITQPSGKPEDRFLINELGSPAYIQDITNNLVDYRYLPDSQSNSTSSPKSITSSSNNSTSFREESEIENHLQYFIKFIQPYFPIFVPSYFNAQYLANEIPSILIYAICALGAHYQTSGEEEYYYQKASIMLDEAAGRPSVHHIQTLLLLIKYMECTPSHQFFEKTKSLITRTIEMCKILKLHQVMISSNSSPDPELETRKRTFCMVYVYNTLLCVEQGIESDFVNTSIKEPVALLPSTLPDESTVECQRYIISFSFTLSKIHQHILRVTQRQQVQKEMRNDAQIIEENMALLQLQVMIENDLMHLPSNLSYHTNKLQHQQFPAEEELATNTLISPMTRILHMIYHLNVMLLHYHYYMHPLPQGAQEKTTNYPHRQLCLSSASIMVRLIEGLVIDSLRSFRFAPRGAQFVSHCVTFALTILNVEKSITKDNNTVYLDEYQRCAQLAQHITSTSPSLEMRAYARELNMNYDMMIDPQPTTNTTIPKRRNTINYPYPMVPQGLLQSSSADVNQFTFPPQQHHHQPLHNIHAAPLHVQNTMNTPMRSGGRTLLRGSSQSCQDLRSMSHNQQQQQDIFMQHRKPVSSVMSTSTTSTNTGPYRHYNTNMSTTTGSRHGSPSLPYSKPMSDISPYTSQSSGFPRQQPPPQQQSLGKIRRIKKSQSVHGLSTASMRQQLQPTYQPMIDPQQQQLQQQLSQLFYTPQQQQQQQQQLHRPYQPSYDDDFKFGTNELEQFPMNVDLNFLNNFSLNISTTNDRVEGHQLL